MQSKSFHLIETNMCLLAGSTPAKSIKERLPGSRKRLFYNSSIKIFEEYLSIGNLESYSYTIEVATHTAINFQVHNPQTHLLYHIDGRRAVRYGQSQSCEEYLFPPHQGVFLYVPETIINVYFEPGNYHLQGFNLPVDLIELGELAEFGFLTEIIATNRLKPRQYKASIGFIASQHTRRILRDLTIELGNKPLIPKIRILRKIEDLLYLCKDKLLIAGRQLYDPDLIVQQARLLISKRIAESDDLVRIKNIANTLNIQPSYLSYLHKERFGIAIMKYRNQELLKKAKVCLRQNNSIKMSTIVCGFKNESSFCNFFKKQMGLTPSSYLLATTTPEE